MMRITVILFFSAFLTANAGGLPQAITLSANNVTLGKIFKESIPPEPVSIITGTVKDAQGKPLAGVSVIVKGTKRGTTTSNDGSFSIDANKGDMLEISGIGYVSTEVAVNGSSVSIELAEDNRNLSEVVVTAIGIKQQKKRLGFTTQEVNTDQLANSRTMNLGTALSGQIAGLTVTNPTGMFQKPSFVLRGKTPLIVIDGVPVETDFYDVSGEDIDNINVLKGVTASALYGSQG